MSNLPTESEPIRLYQGDCLDLIDQLPDDSVDMVITSPPYERARLYLEEGKNLGIARDTEEWVAWMFELVKALAPKVTGPIFIVCEGQTRDYRYTGSPFILVADLIRAGFNLRKPPIFRRVGIPGSGGPDWLRNDYEPVICITRPGKLPWSDNTACGHPPKWAPGGEMSYRNSDDTRRNQWGGGEKSSGNERDVAGEKRPPGRPSHKMTSAKECREIDGRRVTSGHKDGDTPNGDSYIPPAKANPGNVVVQKTYTAEEVDQIIGRASDLIDCKVGGGLMGHELAHENEAPFPLTLAEFFVKSFCRPGGIVLDPFVGSGTSGQAARENGRLFIGFDLRKSQIDLSTRRLAETQPVLF